MSNVPTNLIPTRITGLPEYTGTSTLGYMAYVLDGRTYKVQFSNIAAVGAVPSSRVIATGNGLQGGGDLSQNRTISIIPHGVGYSQLDFTGVTAGTYGSADTIPSLTIDATGRVTAAVNTPVVLPNYVPSSRTVTAGAGLTGGGQLNSNITIALNPSNATPQSLGVAFAGTGTQAARDDHVHPAVDLTDTSETQGVLPLGRGGTGVALSPVVGAVIYADNDSLNQTIAGNVGQVLTSAGGLGAPYWQTITGTGTVTSVSVNTANGFAGTVTDPNINPVLTLRTTVTGVIKGDGTAISAATPAVDYVAPGAVTTSGLTMATDRLLGRTTASTGAVEQITVGTGLSLSAGSLINSAPDQIVSLTGAGTTVVTGTYPSFTITSNDQYVGTVTSVSGTGTVNGLTLTGTVTSSGSLTLGGTLSNVSLTSQVTGTLPVANGGTGATVMGTARTNLGAAASGANTDITSIALTTGTISATPTSGTDIVNKLYADSIASGINFHQSVRLATAAALPANTYNNGASGVGATLTANANGALSVDGVAVVAGNRILVKNEVAGANNGVYTVTQIGSGAAPYILTRATDFDSAGTGVDQIDAGDFFLVTAGSTQSNTSWVQQTPLPITVGTTAIVFTQFAAPVLYSAGTGLTLAGTVFSITNTGVTANTYGSASSVPVIAVNAQGQITSASSTAIVVTPSNFASQTANTFLAAPNGASGTPTFRAIVAADVPTLNQNTTGTAANVTGIVAVANGGTGVTASSGANSVVLRNANQNFAVNNIDFGFTSIATAAGTTTLTVASTNTIFFTGSTTQTVVMPVTNTLVLGSAYFIRNNSTGNITVNSSGGNLIGTILPGTTFHLTCIDTTVTTAAGWDFGFTDFATATGTGNVVLSASPTLTGTANVTNLTASATLSTSGVLSTSSAASVNLIATGTIIIGATNTANGITVGQSTGSQTLNLATGATSSGNTKTVNIGTAGLSGSTTNITIGSAVSGATSTTTLNGTVSIASVIAAPLGAVGTPSYTFTGDTNTGMWSPGADTIAFSEGGVEAMRINSSGNVGIGETSPGARLHVSGGTVGTTAGNLLNVIIGQGIAGTNAVGVRTNLVRVSNGTDWTTTAMRLQGRVDATDFGYIDFVSGGAQGLAFGSGTSERMRIDASGNVGIGTTAPAAKLDVIGTIYSRPGNAAGAVAELTADASSGANGISLIAGFTSGGYGPIKLLTSATERMRIDSSGNVGIGTSGPTTQLDVHGTGTLALRRNATDSTSQILLSQAGTGDSVIDFLLPGVRAWRMGIDNSDSDKFKLQPSQTADFSGAVVTVDTSGNVGIGLSNPTDKLEVNGSSIFRGTALFNPSGSAGTNSAAYIRAANAYSSATTPDYTWWFNDQCGFFHPAANVIGFTTDGTERSRIDASGNLLVGTTSATGRLTVQATDGNTAFFDSTDTAGGLKGVAIRSIATSGTATPFLALRQWRSSFAGNFDVAQIRFDGLTTTGGYAEFASIYAPAGTNTASGAPTSLVFNTMNTSFVAGERMRISANGEVGIGTSSPASLLHVKRGSNAIEVYPTGTWASRIINATDASGENGLLVGNRWAANTSTAFEVGSIFGGGTGSWRSFYKVDGIGQSIWSNEGTERMRLATDGTVGMGVSTPNASLHIAGIRGGNGRMTQSSTGGTNQNNLNIIASSSAGGADQWFSYGVTASNYFFLQTGVGTGDSGLVVNSNNRVMVGTSTAFDTTVGANFMASGSAGSAAAFRVNATTTTQVSFYDSSQTARVGWIGTSGSSTSYNTTSDRRLKKNIQPVGDVGAKIDQIEVVSHEWTNGTDTVIPYAFIAQDLYEAAPHAVSKGDDGDEVGLEWAVDYSKLVPMLVKEVQSLRARVAQLEGK